MRIQDFNVNFLVGSQIQITGTSIEPGNKVGVALGVVLRDGSKMLLRIHEGEISQADGDFDEHFLDSNGTKH